jgi:hypothetical protein
MVAADSDRSRMMAVVTVVNSRLSGRERSVPDAARAEQMGGVAAWVHGDDRLAPDHDHRDDDGESPRCVRWRRTSLKAASGCGASTGLLQRGR